MTTSAVALSGFQTYFNGRTSTLNSNGYMSDTRALTVEHGQSGTYSFAVSGNLTRFELRDSANNSVATGKTDFSPVPVRVNLSRDTYSLLIEMQGKDLPSTDYAVTIERHVQDRTINLTADSTQVHGVANVSGSGGLPQDTRQLLVYDEGEYNFNLTSSLTSFSLINSRNEMIAYGVNQTNPESVSVKLAPGSYQLNITQTTPGAFGRAYAMEINHRTTTAVTTGGGILQGTSSPNALDLATAQKHTVEVVAAGKFDITFSLPYGKFSLVDSSGKTIASGSNTGAEDPDYMKPVTVDLAVGKYEAIISPPNTQTPVGWSLTVMPTTSTAQNDNQSSPSEIQQILQQREARLALEVKNELREGLKKLGARYNLKV
ncbi:hypothetical protein CCP2SC5_30044 [Azospirillaceae bacterium]